MDVLTNIFAAFGLSGSAGLNAYLPLLIVSLTARTAMSRLSGWITSVTSVAVPPVDRLAVDRR